MLGFKTKILSIGSLVLLGMAILMSVIMSQPPHITAQTLESFLLQRTAFKNPQIKLGGGLQDRFEHIALNSNSNKVYVSDSSSNNVLVINGNSGTRTNVITVGLDPTAIAINPASNEVYVANSRDKTVSVIDGKTNKKQDIHVGYRPIAVAVNPIYSKVYVAYAGSNTVSVINSSSNKIEANVTVGYRPIAIAVNPIYPKVYVTGSNTVSVIQAVRIK